MERGRFRHLPVVDGTGKLIGMLSDRDVRWIRPSLAFADKEEANVQLWSTSVQQAAVFEPVKVTPETTVKEAAGLMFRWQVGGLPVVGDKDKLIGIITYTDLLREFVAHGQSDYGRHCWPRRQWSLGISLKSYSPAAENLRSRFLFF